MSTFKSFKELAEHFSINSKKMTNKQESQDSRDHTRFYMELDNPYRMNPDPLMESRNPRVRYMDMGPCTQETNGIEIFIGIVNSFRNRLVGTSDTTWIDQRHEEFRRTLAVDDLYKKQPPKSM